MARRHGQFAGRVGLVAMLWAQAALAQPPELAFDWTAPSSCPTQQDVLAVVTAHIGAPPESVLTAPLVVRARVAEAQRWGLELEWTTRGASEQRRVEADSCAEVARAAALLIALAIDPTRAVPPETEASAAPPPTSSAPRQTSAPRARTSRAPERPRSPPPAGALPASRPAREGPMLAFNASGGVELGSLPGVAPGAVAGFATLFRGFEAQADLGVFGSSEQTPQGAGGRFWELSLALRPCARIERKTVALSPCLAGEVVALSAEGLGMDHTRGQWSGFARLGGGARASFALTRTLGLILDGWLQVPLSGPDFTADGASLFQPKATHFRLTVGIGHRLRS